MLTPPDHCRRNVHTRTQSSGSLYATQFNMLPLVWRATDGLLTCRHTTVQAGVQCAARKMHIGRNCQ